MKHFNELTPAEAERLALLIEECGEVIQAATKVLRHGYESVNPLTDGPTNRTMLTSELGHVIHAIDRMTLAADVNVRALNTAKVVKADRIARWLHHQQPEGVDVG